MSVCVVINFTTFPAFGLVAIIVVIDDIFISITETTFIIINVDADGQYRGTEYTIFAIFRK